jgi:hypothetical protein
MAMTDLMANKIAGATPVLAPVSWNHWVPAWLSSYVGPEAVLSLSGKTTYSIFHEH